MAGDVVRHLGFEPISGASVTGLGSLTVDAHNRAGQVAFLASLSDGTVRLYRATPQPGLVPDDPILPTAAQCPGDICLDPPPGCLDLIIGANGVRCFYDPEYAVGYDYSLTGEAPPAFDSLLVPVPLPGGDNDFTVEFDGQAHAIQSGTVFRFSDHTAAPIMAFAISGIDVTEEIDPTDPEGFVVGLTFDTDVHTDFQVVMNPRTVVVQLPALTPSGATLLAWALSTAGAAAVRSHVRSTVRPEMRRETGG